MNAREFIDSYFIGQERVCNELSANMEAMKNGDNFNILFRAESGHGKTYLATIAINWLTNFGKYAYYLCKSDGLDLKMDRRFQILDEIHLLKEPEYLYPVMDSRKHSFFLMTNEYYNLKEPLENRCFVYSFDEYNLTQLRKISEDFFSRKKIYIPIFVAETIANISRGNPRVAKILSERLSIIFRMTGIPLEEHDLINILIEYLGISEGGFTDNDRRYIDFLMSAGGKAGLSLIKNSLGLPETIITGEIEPFLIRKGILLITSRGRILNDNISRN